MTCTDSCALVKIEYLGNGSQKNFTFPFTYIKNSEVHVELFDETIPAWKTTTDWTFANATTISFKTAPPAPSDSYVKENIRISRCTEIDPMIAQFNPGSAIRARDLNDNFEQLQLAIQDNRCGVEDLQDQIDEGYTIWLNRIDADDTFRGIPGDLVKSNSDLTIDDNHVASTKWIDNRYWDQCEETTYSGDRWVDEIDDVHIPTTRAVEQRLADFQALTGVKKVTGLEQRSQRWNESVTDDDHVATTDALVERFQTKLSVTGADSTVTRSNIDTWLQPGKIWIKSDSAELFYRRTEGTQWIQIDTKGDRGDIGPQGPPGNNGADGMTPEFSIGVVTASPPGADAQVTQTGTTLQPVLNFVLPRGEEGPPGPPGTPGDGGGEILTFTAPLVKTGTTVSIDLLTIPNAP